jgi:hypothetical protein
MVIFTTVNAATRPLRLVVRTLGSHPSNTGSTPVGVTIEIIFYHILSVANLR